MKNYEILTILNGIQTIMQKEMPIKVSFIINKNIKKLQEEVKNFEEARQEIVNKYAEKDENGELIVENDEYKVNNKKRMTEDINELLNIENEITIQKIKIDDFGAINLTPVELSILDFMIEE